MGNIIESDSSDSDIENTETQNKGPHVRTAGDGMEMESNINLNALKDKNVASSSNTANSKKTVDNIRDCGNSEMTTVPEIPNNTVLLKSGMTASAAKSPRELPSRELLIPVKPPKLENIGANSKSPAITPYDQLTVGTKQKNPKFVPYEPYSCATRPIISNTHHQTHVRKPSDSSSIASQASVISTPDPARDCFTPVNDIAASSPKAEQKVSAHTTATSQHHPSTTLMKERLRIAEKEINDLQSENTRLKKLLIDSIVGSPSDSNVQANSYGATESFDNLNDEYRRIVSKFMSSCILVENLSKENHDMSTTIGQAAEIIKDLKNTANLTQQQYERINEWLRKTNNVLYISTLPDSNFNSEEYLDSNS